MSGRSPCSSPLIMMLLRNNVFSWNSSLIFSVSTSSFEPGLSAYHNTFALHNIASIHQNIFFLNNLQCHRPVRLRQNGQFRAISLRYIIEKWDGKGSTRICPAALTPVRCLRALYLITNSLFSFIDKI